MDNHPSQTPNTTVPRPNDATDPPPGQGTGTPLAQEPIEVVGRGQAQRQVALLRLSAELAAAVEEDEVCQRVVQGLHESLGYDNVALDLVDETTGERVAAANAGYMDVPFATHLLPGQGLSARPLEDGQLHYTPDVSQDPRYVPGLGGAEVDVPVHIDGKVQAVLVVESRQPSAFNQDDFEILTAAAQQAGLAIEKARLLAAERGQSQRQAALLRLSADLAAAADEAEVCRRVVNGLHETLGYDNVALDLVDEITRDRVSTATVGFRDAPSVTRLAPGEGLSARPLQDGQLHYTPDVTQDPRFIPGLGGAEVDVPVRIEGEVRGVLVIESRQPYAFDQEDFQVLTAASQQAGLAIENARLLAAERQRANELDALSTTMAGVTAELELSVLLQAIVERAVELLNATFGDLGLYDQTTQEIEVAVSHNLDQDYIGTRHPLGEGAMGYVAETGEPLIIKDYQTWERRAPQYSGLTAHSTLAAPLIVSNRLVGVIAVSDVNPAQQFGPADLHLLILFAQQAAIAIENARLLAAERQRADELDALRNTMADITAELDLSLLLQAIVERAVALLDATAGELGLYEESSEEVQVAFGYNTVEDYATLRHRRGEGAMGTVAETGEPLIIQDYQKWPRRPPQYTEIPIHTALAAPLKIGRRLVGVIAVADSNPSRQFGSADLHLLNLFAQQAAIAIENARLLSAERQRADELDVLRTTMADITAELELSVLLQAIVERAVGLLDTTAGELGLYDQATHDIRIVVSHNLDKDYIGTRHGFGEGAMGTVAETGEPLILRDYHTWERRSTQYTDIAVHSVLAAPLKVGNRLVGAITTSAADPKRQFGPPDMHLLNLFAQQAAIAIENARLYNQAQQAAVVEERGRLARELHDSVTQSLYSLTLLAEAGQRWVAEEELERVAGYLSRIGQVGLQALKEMRLLVYQLRPLALEQEGLVGALQQRLDAVERRAGVQARMLVEGEIELPAAVEEALYRITQEALNNALKHAAPTLVTVTIRVEGGGVPRVELEVADNGKGFDPDAARMEGGMGLISMRERAEKLGGSLIVVSAPGGGTKVKVSVSTREST